MSWASVAGRGGANTKTAGTQVSGSPSGNIVVGAVCFVGCITNNFGTSDGNTSEHSITDTDGNVWTKLHEYTNAEGAAAAGVTVSVFATKVTAQIDTTDSITLTCANSVTAKAICFWEASVAGGMTFQVAGTPQNGDVTANAIGPSMVISGLGSAEYLFLAMDGLEGPSTDTYTRDADYTSAASRGTTGSTDDTNVTGYLSRRIFTGTGDTFASSNSSARDWGSVFVAVSEVAEAVGGGEGFPYLGGRYYA